MVPVCKIGVPKGASGVQISPPAPFYYGGFMSKVSGVLEIKYTIETGKTEFGGNLKKSARKELIEAFLTGQIGQGGR